MGKPWKHWKISNLNLISSLYFACSTFLYHLTFIGLSFHCVLHHMLISISLNSFFSREIIDSTKFISFQWMPNDPRNNDSTLRDYTQTLLWHKLILNFSKKMDWKDESISLRKSYENHEITAFSRGKLFRHIIFMCVSA